MADGFPVGVPIAALFLALLGFLMMRPALRSQKNTAKLLIALVGMLLGLTALSYLNYQEAKHIYTLEAVENIDELGEESRVLVLGHAAGDRDPIYHNDLICPPELSMEMRSGAPGEASEPAILQINPIECIGRPMDHRRLGINVGDEVFAFGEWSSFIDGERYVGHATFSAAGLEHFRTLWEREMWANLVCAVFAGFLAVFFALFLLLLPVFRNLRRDPYASER